MKVKSTFDYGFLLIVLILLSFGLIMVFSASSAFAFYNFNDSYYFVKKQLMWSGLGLVCMFILANYDYRKLKPLAIPFLIISLFLLVAVLVIGTEINGAKRWIGFGNIPSFQPSEVAKLAVIIFLSSSLSKRKGEFTGFFKAFLPYILIVGFVCGLIMLEPHLSGTVVIIIVSMILLFIAGFKFLYFFALGMPALGAFYFLVTQSEYRLKRVTTFLDPWKYKMDDGWQIIQSLYAIGSGGIFGLGLGRSRQKFLYIPEPHNDFIFSIICEELGFIGATVVILLFIILIWKGIRIALNAPDTFSSLLVAGIISLIGVQFIINIAVVTSSMPVTGMPLPFFSAGGSSLLFLLIGIGIILNVSRFSKTKK
jgi:cell division protein FtsW